MPTEPRRQVQDLILTCAEPQYRDNQESTSRAITPSAMSTTTLTSGLLTSAYVGAYVVPEDGNARGMRRQIVSFVVSTGVATVDAPWTNVSGVTTVRSWLPSDVPARSTATGTTTAVTSSPHISITNEPTSYWAGKGYFLLAKGAGSNAGGAYKINAFTTGTGVFDLTGDPLVTGAADGELFLIRKRLRPEAPVTASVNRKTLTRRLVGSYDADQAVPITAEGSVEIPLPQKPVTTAAANGVAAVGPQEIGEILADWNTQTLDTGSTRSAFSTGSLTVAGGTFSVGGFVLTAAGEAGHVEAIAANVITSRQLLTDPGAASIVYASAWYQRKTSDFRTRMFDLYRGAVHRQVFHGCVPTAEIAISRDQIVKFNLKYSAADAGEYAIPNPNALAGHAFAIADQTVPVDAKGSRLLIGTTACILGDCKINLGIKGVPRPSLSGINQMDGMSFDFDPVTITMTGYLADNDDTAALTDIQDQLNSGNTVYLFYQKGTNPKETWCWAAPAAQLTKSTFGYENGIGAFSLEAVCVLPQAVRGNAFGSTLPAFSMGWL